MEPITLIIGALAAGAAAGGKDAASRAVRDGYDALHKRLTRHVSSGSDGAVALRNFEEDAGGSPDQPSVWAGPLEEELKKCDADSDVALVRAARELLEAAGGQTQLPTYSVQNSSGVLIGNNSTQNNEWTGIHGT